MPFNASLVRTPRLRLYTQNSAYLRMLQGLWDHRQESVAQTEERIRQYTGAKHAVLTSMGRMAIYHGLCALPKKGEIILSPITVPEVISLVVLSGFTPVFCDTKPGTWNMDTDLIEGLITDKTTAIMTTHFYGNTNTTQAVRAICDKHKLYMVEDAAQAFGSWNGSKHAGLTGDFGILSFSYPKNVTSFYGGCLITNDDAIAASARRMVDALPPSDMQWVHKKVISCIIKDVLTSTIPFQFMARLIQYGYKNRVKWIMNAVTQELNPTLLPAVPAPYNHQISPQQARVLADKFPQIDEDAAHRIRCAEIYYAALKDIPKLICPQPPGDRSHTFLYYPIEVEDKYKLQDFMIEQGCDVAIQHAANCADLDAYRPWYRDCPKARAAYKGTLMLPAWRGFPLAQAEQYARCIRAYFNA